MAYETILTEKEGKIGFLTLNRPDDFNRQTLTMCREIEAALKEFEKDDDVYVVIIKGAGKHFCVGVSLEDFKGKTPLELLEILEAFDNMNDALGDFPKATISAVQGLAMAGGAGIATRPDITILEEDAQIGLTAINAGLSCMKGVRSSEAIMGSKRALEYILTGKLMSAQDAERFGFINQIAPKGKLHEVAMENANLLASKSPTAIKFTKIGNTKTRNMSREDATRFLTEHFVLLLQTEDAAEGLAAFAEKREPVWKRR